MQVHRTLCKRIAAQYRPRDIPQLVFDGRVSRKSDKCLKKCAQAVSENTNRPPEEMRAALYEVSSQNPEQKEDREQRSQDRNIVDWLQMISELVHFHSRKAQYSDLIKPNPLWCMI